MISTAQNPTHTPVKHTGAEQIARMLQAGHVYRREDFTTVSKAVDRHLQQLVCRGTLKRIAQGMYYAPKKSVFGDVPPADHDLIAKFLRDQDFLMLSPSLYNTLGVGTTQLYNQTRVYNRKRHGVFVFGNRQFDFRVKHHFPHQLTPEFLLVDMINTLHELAEDQYTVIERIKQKCATFDPIKLAEAVTAYGSVSTQKRFEMWRHA